MLVLAAGRSSSSQWNAAGGAAGVDGSTAGRAAEVDCGAVARQRGTGLAAGGSSKGRW